MVHAADLLCPRSIYIYIWFLTRSPELGFTPNVTCHTSHDSRVSFWVLDSIFPVRPATTHGFPPLSLRSSAEDPTSFTPPKEYLLYISVVPSFYCTKRFSEGLNRIPYTSTYFSTPACRKSNPGKEVQRNKRTYTEHQ
jgi:hypothetical protein